MSIEWPTHLPKLPEGISLISAQLGPDYCDGFELTWEDEFTKKRIVAKGGKDDDLQSVYKMCEGILWEEFCYLRAASLRKQGKKSLRFDEVESWLKANRTGPSGKCRTVTEMQKYIEDMDT